MKRLIVSALLVVFALSVWQPRAFTQNGAAPTVAFDITKADIDYVLKNAPANPPDRQLRVVDMGKYNLGVGIVHRGPTNEKPGDPIPVIYHDYTPETYIIVSGSGVLTRRLSRSVCAPSGAVCIRARTSASAVRNSSVFCCL